jgi:phosphoesterase RecJ-like protein
MMNEIAEILRTHDRFLIVTHVNPDGDAVGSLLGMYMALKEMGKQAWALSKEKLPELYDFLPGIKAVLTDGEASVTEPEWIIAVDVASAERISGDIKRLGGRPRTINIDHHPTNPRFGHLNLVDPSATSTAELVFQVLKKAGYTLSADVGKCLYTGLITDTGCFRFAGVGSSTLSLAAEILESGFDPYQVARPLFEEYPLRRLELERLMLERIEVLLDGRLIMSTLLADDFERLGAQVAETEDLVNRLRQSRGVEVGILVTGLSNELYRVSFRSKGRVDVAMVAASLGGGGHRHAAGLRSSLPLKKLRDLIIQAVAEALSQ